MNKYKVGDKVVIRKDLKAGKWYDDIEWWSEMDDFKGKDYVVIIEEVDSFDVYRIEGAWCINDEMIEGLYKEEDKMSVKTDKNYIWYLDYEDGTYFLNNLLGVEKWRSHETEEIKNGKDMCYLLTEEQAKKSPFFDKFAKHDPFKEKLYYILVKGHEWEDRQFLNMEVESYRYFFDNDVETDGFKITFTEKEADEIIGNSSILYKEECE